MSVCFLLCLLFCTTSVFCGHENVFQNYENYYKRNTYEDADFHDYSIEEFLSDNHTKDEYRIFISKGVNRYLTITHVMKEKRNAEGEYHHVEDRLNITENSFGDVVLNHVQGLSKIVVTDPHLTTLDEHKFEVRSTFTFPLIIFSGHVTDENKTFEYKLMDVSYTDRERKKVNDYFEIEPVQSTERFDFHDTKLFLSESSVPANSTHEKEIKEAVSFYLPKVAEIIKRNTKNYSLESDIWYLRIKREDVIHKLAQIVTKTAKTFDPIVYHLPRFTFKDEKTSFEYELISGTLEIDTNILQASAKILNDVDGVEFSSPVQGLLSYYVAEKNCNESCHFYGHRFKIQKVDARVTFTEKEINNVEWYFEMKYLESLVDSHHKMAGDDLFDIILANVSKIVNDKFLYFLKTFVN